VGVGVDTAVFTSKTATADGVIVGSFVAQPTQKKRMSSRDEVTFFNMLYTLPN
jgi:hypothetical protein